MDDIYSAEPWYLTIVRTQGILFIRPEKSWRPIVSITVGGHHAHELVLGSDGQNPNLKTPFILRDLDPSHHLDLRVFHKSHSKNRKKRHLVGSAYVTVGDILRRQSHPGCDLDLRLSCPPPQKRSPTIGGTRQSNTATLTIRLRPPPPLPPSSSVTAVDSPLLSQDEDALHSDAFSDRPPSVSSERKPQDPAPVIPEGSSVLRNRKKRPKVKPYTIHTTDEEHYSSESSCYPPSPIDTQPICYPTIYEGENEACEEMSAPICTRVLPQYHDQDSVHYPLLEFMGRIVNRFAPYNELCQARDESQYGEILGRLLTEWYVIGGSLLAVAGVNAAVFGFSSDSMFAVDGLAKRAIAIGSLAAGIGIVTDAWFLVRYSGADIAKFQRLIVDVYDSYVFFCFTCRLPALCMFIAACGLMVFLFTVAWEAWPTAVLVMSFIAGLIVTLQYLVFGIHRLVRMIGWGFKTFWSRCRSLLHGSPQVEPTPVQQVGQATSETAS